MKPVWIYITLILLLQTPLIAFAEGVVLTVTIAGGGDGGGNGGGGGSGGAGGGVPRPTAVVFRGLASPAASVALLKDGQTVIAATASNSAFFELTLTGLAGGNYILNIFGRDPAGLRASVVSIPLLVTPNVTTIVSNIFLSPTLSSDKSSVRGGGAIVFFGRTVPGALVRVSIPERPALYPERAGAAGRYQYTAPIINWPDGRYLALAQSAITAQESPASPPLTFWVGESDVRRESEPLFLPEIFTRLDINNDSKINLVDLSILTYWFGRPNPPATLDLNGDGQIDLVDISIAVFYWTG